MSKRKRNEIIPKEKDINVINHYPYLYLSLQALNFLEDRKK